MTGCRKGDDAVAGGVDTRIAFLICRERHLVQRLVAMSFALLRRDAIAQAIDLQRCSLVSDHLACPQKVSITDSQSVSWRCIVFVQVH